MKTQNGSLREKYDKYYAEELIYWKWSKNVQ